MSETAGDQMQIPWESSSLVGEPFYFADSGGSTVVVKPPAPRVPPPPQEPETASLTVTCDTPGSVVTVNGHEHGNAPVTVSIEKAGSYTVKVTADGYKPYTKKEKIELGDTVTVEAYLEKERPAAVPAPAPAPVSRTDRFTNSIGQEFVYIEPGSFMMGSPENEPGHDSDEKQHKVTLTKGFYMQTTEVTQGQWKAIMGNNPSSFKECGDNCPVENVSWDDAQEFIKKLSRKEGKEYRLPTEAEWEYAARAGTQTAYHWGNQAECSKMMFENDPGSSETKCVDYVKGRGLTPDSTAPVKSYPANSWGLYDMHGNVWEWCADWYGDYPAGSVTNPEGSSTGSNRVKRGGSWYYYAGNCRSAYRGHFTPSAGSGVLGFRLVLSTGHQVSRAGTCRPLRSMEKARQTAEYGE